MVSLAVCLRDLGPTAISNLDKLATELKYY